MDRDHCVSEAERQLNDSAFYKPLDHDPTPEFAKQVSDTVREMHDQGHISEKNMTYFIVDQLKAGRIYLLQKKHKAGNPGRPLFLTLSLYIYTEGYSESTEPIDAVNILPLARFEPTTSATRPSTTPDTDATNCSTETSPTKDVQEALILTTTDAVHVVYWFFFNGWHLFRSQVKA